MAHIQVPEAEALLDKEIKVLDHGFVRLVDYMAATHIVQTARVSYGEGTKTVREDAGLIDYLPAMNTPLRLNMWFLSFTPKCPSLWRDNGFGIAPPVSMKFLDDTP